MITRIFLILHFLLLFLNKNADALLNSESDNKFKTNVCKKILENIIYKPETCAYNYLNQIAEEFKLNDQIIFTSQAESYAYKFAQCYGVFVTFMDTLGKFTVFGPNGESQIFNLPTLYYMVQNYLNLPVFMYYPIYASYYYSFNVYSKLGMYYNVMLTTVPGKFSDICIR